MKRDQERVMDLRTDRAYERRKAEYEARPERFFCRSCSEVEVGVEGETCSDCLACDADTAPVCASCRCMEVDPNHAPCCSGACRETHQALQRLVALKARKEVARAR